MGELHPQGGVDYPAIVTAVNDAAKLAQAGCYGARSTAATTTDSDGVAAFLGGRGAMFFWSNEPSSAFAGAGGSNNIGVFPWPKAPGSVYPAGTPQLDIT